MGSRNTMRELIQSEIERLTAEHKQAMQQVEEWQKRRFLLEGSITALTRLLETPEPESKPVARSASQV